MAALLACGERSAISHSSAAFLWQILPGASRPQPIELTVLGNTHRGREGLRIHRTRVLAEEDVTERDGIRLITAARTLLAVASGSGPRSLEGPLRRALDLRLTTTDELVGLLAAHPGCRGAPVLRALLGREPTATDSEAEVRLLDLIRRAQLPPPKTGVAIRGHKLDFCWVKERFAVEVDGFAHHSSRTMFERDRARDADLLAEGMRVMRVTWKQLSREPEALIARVAQALAR
jgi:very-short-patch-repair endonuclease